MGLRAEVTAQDMEDTFQEGLAVTHDDLQRPVRVIPENTWEKYPGKPPGILGFYPGFWHFLLADR